MGVRSIDEINREYLKKNGGKNAVKGRFFDILFWLFVFLLLVALLSFNHNSFATRPVFGYSLYITKDDGNLFLVKNERGLTKQLVYDEKYGEVDIGIIKANFPKLGKAVQFLTDKIYVVVVLSGIWLFIHYSGNRLIYGNTRKGVRK